jgi:hypothetical protein
MPLLYELRGKSLPELIRNEHGDKFYFSHGWCYLDFITTLIRKRIHSNKLAPNAWTTLKSNRLNERYGKIGPRGAQRRVLSVIRQDLVKWEVIMYHTVQVAKEERRADYKLKDERWAEGFQLSQVALPRAYQQEAPAQPRAKGIHGKLQTIVNKSLTIDYAASVAFCDQALGTSMKLKDKAIDWKELGETKSYAKCRNRVVNEEVHSLWLYHINRIVAKDFRFKHDETTGRDFTTVTATPSHIRPFLLLDKKPVVESDVSCAQPLLFTKLVYEYCDTRGMSEVPTDVHKWQRLCEEKEPNKALYEHLFRSMTSAKVQLNCLRTVDPLTHQVKFTNEYTKAFKVEFFAGIFFDKDKNSQMRQVFAQEFPTISAAITYWKQQLGDNLPVRLQKLEAELLLNQVCPLLLKQRIKVYTVHDAILSHPEHKQTVAATIRRVFLEATGLTPVIK